MKKLLTFLSLFILVIAAGSTLAYFDFKAAERFSAEGVVTKAEWNTKNHKMSLFIIKNEYSAKKFHHYRVTLTPEQIKVGDTFSKAKGSKLCLINNLQTQCVK